MKQFIVLAIAIAAGFLLGSYIKKAIDKKSGTTTPPAA